MVSASSKALEDHLRNGGFSGTVRAASLSWGRANAQAFARVHGRADLVIASECLYALKATDLSVAAATMEALASTIAELLSMNGVCLVLYNPRSDVEAYFWDALPRFNLRRRADSRWTTSASPPSTAPPLTLRRRARGRRAAFANFPPDSRVAADDARGGARLIHGWGRRLEFPFRAGLATVGLLRSGSAPARPIATRVDRVGDLLGQVPPGHVVIWRGPDTRPRSRATRRFPARCTRRLSGGDISSAFGAAGSWLGAREPPSRAAAAVAR